MPITLESSDSTVLCLRKEGHRLENRGVQQATTTLKDVGSKGPQFFIGGLLDMLFTLIYKWLSHKVSLL